MTLHLRNRKTTASALQDRQPRQLIISSSQPWESMSRLSGNSEIEQSSSACKLATVAAAQSIQIIRYSSFCTSIQFHSMSSFDQFILSQSIYLVHSFSSLTQFIHSVHSLSSLSQSTLTHSVHSLSPLTQFTHSVHSLSSSFSSLTQFIHSVHSLSSFTQFTHPVHPVSQHSLSQFTQSVNTHSVSLSS
jgi:hypothetical protein